jgi:hypothetical protein
MSFPRDRGDLSPQVYATLLLIAAVRLHGGELRLPAIMLEDVRGGMSILHDFDSTTQELVLRCGSVSANLLALPQEEKWATKPNPLPAKPLPTFSDRLNATSASASTLDNERVAELERQKGRENLMRDLRQRRSSTLQEMFSTDLDEALRKDGGRTG